MICLPKSDKKDKDLQIAEKKAKKPTFKSPESEMHKNHRNNMRGKFLKYGIDCFTEHEIIEMLLYHVIPMKDTNPIAHRLLDEYGSVSALFDASYEQLMQSGLTHTAATFIKFIQQLATYYNFDKFYDEKKRLDSALLKKKLIGLTERSDGEVMILGLYDMSSREIFLGIIDSGGKSSVNLIIEKIVKRVYATASCRLAIIAHNHPSGILFPSQSDVDMTEKVRDELKRINVTLIDHYLIANGDCKSIDEIFENQ